MAAQAEEQNRASVLAPPSRAAPDPRTRPDGCEDALQGHPARGPAQPANLLRAGGGSVVTCHHVFDVWRRDAHGLGTPAHAPWFPCLVWGQDVGTSERVGVSALLALGRPIFIDARCRGLSRGLRK